jgi:hypothetical protein
MARIRMPSKESLDRIFLQLLATLTGLCAQTVQGARPSRVA